MIYILNDDGTLKAEAFDGDNTIGDQKTTTIAPPPWRDGFVRVFNGSKWVELERKLSNERPAQPMRRMYPPITEQLDMLWHAMDRGDIPKAGEFYETIKAVKDSTPATPKIFEVGRMPE